MLSVGTVIGERWRLERQLGVGGLSHVWLVRHVELGSLQALKMLTVQRPRLGERLLREGRIQAQLQHPHIVPVRDVVRHEGYVGLVMDYVEGMALDAYLDAQGALPLDVAMGLMAPVMGAVAAAHDAGVLHRDLKPANILLARTSQGYVPKVADFGIAKLLEEEDGAGHTRSGAVLGTPGYLAPEQANDASTVDERADVFALGVVFYEMVSGQRAYEGEILDASLAMPPPRLDARVASTPAHVAEAVRVAISPKPDDRYAGVRDFAAALFRDHPFLLVQTAASTTPAPLPGEGVAAGPRSFTPAPPTTPVPAGDPTPARRVLAQESGAPAWMAGLAVALLLSALAIVGWLWTVRGAQTAVTTEVGTPVGLPAEAVIDAIPTAPPATEVPAPVEATPTEAPEVPPAPDAAREQPVTSAAPPKPAAPTEPAPADPPPASAPVPAPPEPEVASPSPPAAPPPTDDAVAEVAEVVEATPAPPPAPVYAQIEGLWRGDANGKPLRLRITSQQGAQLTGSVTFVLGPTERSYPVTGTLTPAGALSLRDADGVLKLDAQVDVPAMQGTYASGGPRTQPFAARWVSR